MGETRLSLIGKRNMPSQLGNFPRGNGDPRGSAPLRAGNALPGVGLGAPRTRLVVGGERQGVASRRTSYPRGGVAGGGGRKGAARPAERWAERCPSTARPVATIFPISCPAMGLLCALRLILMGPRRGRGSDGDGAGANFSPDLVFGARVGIKNRGSGRGPLPS